jgi:hypothetical protein
MIVFGRMTIAIVVVAAAVVFSAHDAFAPRAATASAATSGETYGMRQYTDTKYGFSFWYPSALHITVSSARDVKSFPGGVMVETLQVGEPDGPAMHVVNSAKSTITDEPDGHAAPIAQTRYFYDPSARKWMVAYPEGKPDGTSGATAPADVSKKTIGGLPMLPSDARFDTTIIPLSTTRFIVVQDGGGSAFTNELAQTVAPAGASVDPSARSAALQAEAAAYKKQ